MKTTLLSLLAFVLALGLSPLLKAEKGDPDSNKWKVATVEWVKRSSDSDHRDIDDKWVVLIGRVTQQVDEDTYILDDGTGTILLDVEDEDIIQLPVGKRVVVRGHVDEAYWDIGELELNVHSWRPERKS
jgi:uncharacterized protein YdeI (BOF family)